MPVYCAVKKKVMPERARRSIAGKSFHSIGFLFCVTIFRIKSIARNSAPAMRNLKVAIAIGVNPFLRAILTTTKELPQSVMRTSIRKALKALIPLVVILNSLFPNVLRYIVTCCCFSVDHN